MTFHIQTKLPTGLQQQRMLDKDRTVHKLQMVTILFKVKWQVTWLSESINKTFTNSYDAIYCTHTTVARLHKACHSARVKAIY